VLGLFAIPPIFFRYNNYIYDPMTLFVFTLCIYLIVKRHHLLYCLLFLAASLNKETAISLIPLFFIREVSTITKGRAILLGVWQVISFIFVKLYLAHEFQGKAGAFVGFHLQHNLRLLGDVWFYLKTPMIVFPITILIACRWKEKSLFLRRGLVVCAILLFASAVFLGYVDELRGYYELYAMALLLIIPKGVKAYAPAGTPATGNGEPEGQFEFNPSA
jgi:hypothetical protein